MHVDRTAKHVGHSRISEILRLVTLQRAGDCLQLGWKGSQGKAAKAMVR
jgi:hypothetical protein